MLAVAGAHSTLLYRHPVAPLSRVVQTVAYRLGLLTFVDFFVGNTCGSHAADVILAAALGSCAVRLRTGL